MLKLPKYIALTAISGALVVASILIYNAHEAFVVGKE